MGLRLDPRNRFVHACCVAVCAALLPPMDMASAAPLETAVKATFLHKFASYVVWPATLFASPSTPFVICVVGYDPFGAVLDAAAKGQTVGERPIQLRRMPVWSANAGCHVAYFGGSPAQSIAEALRMASGEPVLTVTDSAVGWQPHGIVHFEVRKGRVGFHIDDALAARGGLAISSKLLGLAFSVQARNRS